MIDNIKEENYNSRIITQFISRYEIYDLVAGKRLGDLNPDLCKRREVSVVHPDAAFMMNFNYAIPLYPSGTLFRKLDTNLSNIRQKPSWTPKIDEAICQGHDDKLRFEIAAFLSKLPNEIIKILDLKRE